MGAVECCLNRRHAAESPACPAQPRNLSPPTRPRPPLPQSPLPQELQPLRIGELLANPERLRRELPPLPIGTPRRPAPGTPHWQFTPEEASWLYERVRHTFDPMHHRELGSGNSHDGAMSPDVYGDVSDITAISESETEWGTHSWNGTYGPYGDPNWEYSPPWVSRDASYERVTPCSSPASVAPSEGSSFACDPEPFPPRWWPWQCRDYSPPLRMAT